MGQPQIQRADPQTRQRALITVSFVFGIALVLFLFADPWLATLRSFLAQNIDLILRKPVLSIGIGLLIMSPLVLFSIYFYSLGAKIVAQRRSPLAGQRVIKDTRVLSGRAAIFQGRVAQVLAAVLMFASITAPILLWMILSRIAAGT